MPGYTTINVTYSGGEIECPAEARVTFAPEGPNGARWVVQSYPEGAARLVIQWKQGSGPFKEYGVEVDPEVSSELPVIVGTGNNGLKGRYEYTLRFLDENDAEVKTLDPAIINEPMPWS